MRWIKQTKRGFTIYRPYKRSDYVGRLLAFVIVTIIPFILLDSYLLAGICVVLSGLVLLPITKPFAFCINSHKGVVINEFLKSYPIADLEIIENSATDRMRWVKERFDCDDFALVLKSHFCEAAYKDGDRRPAHCFGIVWGMLPGPHAINWMLNADRVLRFVEPQSDDVFLPRDSDRRIRFMMA